MEPLFTTPLTMAVFLADPGIVHNVNGARYAVVAANLRQLADWIEARPGFNVMSVRLFTHDPPSWEVIGWGSVREVA